MPVTDQNAIFYEEPREVGMKRDGYCAERATLIGETAKSWLTGSKERTDTWTKAEYKVVEVNE